MRGCDASPIHEMITRQGSILAAGLLALLALLAFPLRPAFSPALMPLQPAPAVLIGAGDICFYGQDNDRKTAALVERLIAQYPQAAVFTAGDNVQIGGEPFEFDGCFEKSWGRFKERIHPSPGNHDWLSRNGTEYFRYFGPAAGKHGQGYYSYDLGDWHIVSLNSNCPGGDCSENSPQAQWLRADLRENARRCTMLYWHHPLLDSGLADVSDAGLAFWDIASEYSAEIVVNGHDHHYERFAPLDREGNVDRANGIRTFIVGTGGGWLYDLGEPLAITESRNNTAYGVIQFLLYPDRYEWKFNPIDGQTFIDAGEGTCH